MPASEHKGMPGTRFLLGLMLLWPLGEAAFRYPGIALGRAAGDAGLGDSVALLAGFPLLAGGLAALAIRHGLPARAWGYGGGARAWWLGAGAGILFLAVLAPLVVVDRALFGGEGAVAAAAPSGAVAAGTLLLANGLVVPVAEELFWRGVVQTGLVARLGAARGIALTALGFSLKHALVDLSPGRLLTLLGLGLLLGWLRHRRGTLASSGAHLSGNLLATAAYLVSA